MAARASADAAPIRLRRLLPDPGEVSPEEATSGLRLEELAGEGRPYVVLNMISTLDGKATLDGRTAGIGSRADRALFHGLRTQADAVMAGAGTMRVERYGRIVRDPERRARRRREGLAEDPIACVVSGSLAGLEDLPLVEAPEQRVVVITGAEGEAPAGEARVELLRAAPAREDADADAAPDVSGHGRADLAAALARLRSEWNVRSVLCEGGPALNAELLRAGLVDELFLSLAPMLVGGRDALTIVTGDALAEPVSLEPIWMLEYGGELFLRLRVGAAGGSAAASL